MKIYDIAIIGSGPAGLMAAIMAAQKGRSVLVLEKNDRIGRKILATGNGRCNVTNKNIQPNRYHGGNQNFIAGVLNSYGSDKVIDFFESRGVILKEENNGRVFPRTNQASTIVEALLHELVELGVDLRLSSEVKNVTKTKLWDISTSDKETFYAQKLLLATGGKAAHQFGSSGDGLYFAQKLGHTITPIFAALCPVETEEEWVKNIQGIKIEAEVTSEQNGKPLLKTAGDAIFTHFGVSGPAVMAQSRVIAPALENGPVKISFDLYPEVSENDLDQRLEKLFKENSKKSVKNNLCGFLTSGLVPVILKGAEINPEKKSAEISRKTRKDIIEQIKHLELTVKKIRPLKEAQVTAGGVALSEIDPKTLESKIVPGLYLAGEILDVDGDSGGFNLQWAWSSGFIVGENA